MAIEADIIGINEGGLLAVKSSGLGRDGSKYGIEDCLEIEYLAP
jgi:succinate-semialdehyde dehydrogenase/glutarate-semialdehyde dehydrogenase